MVVRLFADNRAPQYLFFVTQSHIILPTQVQHLQACSCKLAHVSLEYLLAEKSCLCCSFRVVLAIDTLQRLCICEPALIVARIRVDDIRAFISSRQIPSADGRLLGYSQG
jgi:hypothetical protein